jgi:hypothetical protein
MSGGCATSALSEALLWPKFADLINEAMHALSMLAPADGGVYVQNFTTTLFVKKKRKPTQCESKGEGPLKGHPHLTPTSQALRLSIFLVVNGHLRN